LCKDCLKKDRIRKGINEIELENNKKKIELENHLKKENNKKIEKNKNKKLLEIKKSEDKFKKLKSLIGLFLSFLVSTLVYINYASNYFWWEDSLLYMLIDMGIKSFKFPLLFLIVIILSASYILILNRYKIGDFIVRIIKKIWKSV
jgi:hypothetical protein